MTKQIDILLIEDDISLGGSLKEYLSGKDCSVTWLTDERNLETCNLSGFQVVILDLILNYIPGEEILGRIREKDQDIPVLVLTAKAEMRDKETCFRIGADDYLTKPFEPLELLLRIRALCRRISRGEHFCCGDVEVDLDSQLIYKNGSEIKLSHKAWELLCLLIRYQGQLVDKETIMSRVWSDVIISEDAIRHYIKELRDILPENSIETYKTRGYRLRA